MKKTKKLISFITFASLMLLNVPVYANVSPPTVNVETTTDTTTEATVTDGTTTDTTTEDTVTADTTTDTTTEDTVTDDTTTDTTTEDTVTDDTTTDTTTEDTVTADTTTDTTTEVSISINPDDALYVLDRLLEDIQITLTFDDVNKAALLASLTEERLSEVNYLLDKAQTEEVDQEEWDILIDNVVTDYKNKLESAIESVEEVAINVTDEDKEKLDEILTKLDESLEVDEDVLETDEEIGQAIDRAILVANVVKDLDREKVTEMRNNGLGLGQISQVFALAEAADKDVDEVALLFVDQGLGFGDVAKELGVSPSEIAKKKVAEKKLKRNNWKNRDNDESIGDDEQLEIDEENDENELSADIESNESTITQTDDEDEDNAMHEDEDDDEHEKGNRNHDRPSKGKGNNKSKK